MIESSIQDSQSTQALTAKVGRGGKRFGAGRKPGPPRTASCQYCCESFRVRSFRQRFCSTKCSALARPLVGPRGGVRHTTRACRICGTSYQPRYASQVACSRPCGQEWIIRTRSRAGSDDRVRVRRRRASANRRRWGAKTQVGRWRRICERDGWLCWICGLEIDASLSVPHRHAGTADHVVPVSLGGSDTDNNLRAAHLACNSRRGAGKFTPTWCLS